MVYSLAGSTFFYGRLTTVRRSRSTPRPTKVQNMFNDISGRYDIMNRLMTFGRDRSWRRFVAETALLPVHGLLLDAGTGTGDIAFSVLNHYRAARVVGADFSFEMIEVGQKRRQGEQVLWCCSDALELPFKNDTFDAVTSGYLMRNVSNIHLALRESMRVLRPGGRLVCLDTTPPSHNVWRPLILMHLKFVIPLLGLIVAQNRDAYRYLQESTECFVTPKELASIMREAGFKDVCHRKFMMGTMAVHWGTCP